VGQELLQPEQYWIRAHCTPLDYSLSTLFL